MKSLLKTLTTKSSLRLLLGENINYEFPLKYPESNDNKKLKLTLSVPLSEIISATPNLKKQSFDPRFDGKHPIELAVNQIHEKGLTKGNVYKILKNKASVKAKNIKGPLLYLANFITDEHREYIRGELQKITEDKYGNLIRNGGIF